MSRKEEYERRTWDLMIPIAEELGLQLVDCEFSREGQSYALVVYIDKEGGVGVNDCEAVSDRLNPLLDKEDYIAETYTLYVSSPGLGRKLRRPHDFEWAMGKEVEGKTYRAIDSKKDFKGILKEYDGKTIVIDEDGQDVRYTLKDISLIRKADDF